MVVAQQGLADVKARKAELLKVTEASRVQASEAEDQTMMTSTFVMFLEEERSMMIVPSPDELRAKTRERLYKAKAGKVKKLEDEIKKLGRLE